MTGGRYPEGSFLKMNCDGRKVNLYVCGKVECMKALEGKLEGDSARSLTVATDPNPNGGERSW